MSRILILKPASLPAVRRRLRGAFARKCARLSAAGVHATWLAEEFLIAAFVSLVRRGDRAFGPRFVSAFTFPFVAITILCRAGSYPGFRRYRKALPEEFLRCHPFSHFFRMLQGWYESLIVPMLYDRLSSPAWARRMTVRGKLPDQLPGWGERPVVAAFFHTGGYILLRYWLRARGVRASTWGLAAPKILGNAVDGIRDRGDALYGLRDVPHTFRGGNLLRQALRSLQPGRVLIFALDAVEFSESLVKCRVDGKVVFLADGAVRMAKRANAILVPVSVHRIGCCRFEFRFGEPVPDHTMEAASTEGAMNHLAKEMWKGLEADPTSIGWSTLRAFAPEAQKEWLFP